MITLEQSVEGRLGCRRCLDCDRVLFGGYITLRPLYEQDARREVYSRRFCYLALRELGDFPTRDTTGPWLVFKPRHGLKFVAKEQWT